MDMLDLQYPLVDISEDTKVRFLLTFLVMYNPLVFLNVLTDYQLKESGYESSSGQYRLANCNNNGWANGRPPGAIFPSDVDEDDLDGGQGQGLLCQQHRATSVSSLPQSGEESDTMLSTHSSSPSWRGGGEERQWRGGEDRGEERDHERQWRGGEERQWRGETERENEQQQWRGGDNNRHWREEERDNERHWRGEENRMIGGGGGKGLSGSTLSTFHPGPTNHDRCSSRPIALPSVCGETSDSSVGTVTATTQTPCPNCRQCDDRQADNRLGLSPNSGVDVGVHDVSSSRHTHDSGVSMGQMVASREIVTRCEACSNNQQRHHHHRLYSENGSASDSSAQRRPPPPAVPPRASSFSSLPSTERPLRPVGPGSGGPAGVAGHCCGRGAGGGCGGQHAGASATLPPPCSQHHIHGE